MKQLEFPQTHCLAAMVSADITPPVGIFHRMWGAARHDRATGVHRPLLATLLWMEPANGDIESALLTVALDHCILDNPDIELIQMAAAQAAAVRTKQVLVTLSHTHSAGLMSRSRQADPGGELIGSYLDDVVKRVGALAKEAADARRPATIQYAYGRCDMAWHRDYWDPDDERYVCGLNPQGHADDTLLVGRVLDESGSYIGTIVNYACHPTTLAWENTLISPDYPGALREMISKQTGAPCLFLLGAAGDLGPRDVYVGDVSVADRNGRQLGYAALATLEGMPDDRQTLTYQGAVVSGALLGKWNYEPSSCGTIDEQSDWQIAAWSADLPYRIELPTLEETDSELSQWQATEAEAGAAGDEHTAQDCRAHVEQCTRQRWRLSSLHPGKAYHLPVTVARLGQALWVFVAGEHYQQLQMTLRERFTDVPVVVVTLTGGWQPGYIPPARTYGYEIYQEQIAVVGPGSAEILLEQIAREATALLD